MASPRKSNTLQERFGFMDHELTTPKHDEIMLWLDANYQQVIRTQCGHKSNEGLIWNPEHVQRIFADDLKKLEAAEKEIEARMEKAKTAGDKLWEFYRPPEHADDILKMIDLLRTKIKTLAPIPLHDIEFKKPVWEKPVMSKQYTVGFIDMQVSYATPRELWANLYNHTRGYEDILRLPNPSDVVKCQYDDHIINFEVKPSIPSLGEVIRQIRLYETYQGGKYAIVSPDDRFAKALADQGIMFVKAEV